VHKQRYWTWAKRANGTHRIKMPLSEEHESREVMDLREFREQGAAHTAKHALMDLKLFLESPAPNPDKDLVQVGDEGWGWGWWSGCW
jgi:ubiquitin carboxyl-terminal hydrolase 7